MLTHTYCGIETEYGIITRGLELSPVVASSLLVSAYGGAASAIDWDFSQERPFADARGFLVGDRLDPEIDYQLVNRVLENGARYYVDHAHPEYSSPECMTASDALLFDVAGEVIMRRSMMLARETLAVHGAEIIVYKNNSDGKGNSYGCHENYLVSRSVPFGDLVRHMTTHFVSRQIFTGSGKLGVENGLSGGPGLFQISQRADFFEEEVGLETTLRRPIINTRDEPHADPAKYRRFHVIVGDANMSHTATLLKIGTTQIILTMLDEGRIPEDLVVADPLRSMRDVSRDVELTGFVRMANGRLLTALDIQFAFLVAAEDWAESRLAGDKVDRDRRLILRMWRDVLEGLARDPRLLADRIDWIAKRNLIQGYRARHDLAEDDLRLKALDLQYHDLRPERSLARRVGLVTLIEESSAHHAVDAPPRDTRAFLRGEMLKRWPQHVVSANWDSIVLDLGHGSLVRLPMDEPGVGTCNDMALILDQGAELHEVVAQFTRLTEF